ncbi:MAG: DUF2142 domain-containing protein, partial [Bacteroidota bacterium]
INAYALSDGRIVPEVINGTVGHPMPISLIQELKSSQGISFENGVRISKENLIEKSNAGSSLLKDSVCEATNYNILPLSYLPSAVSLKIARAFTVNPIWLGWWARMGMLIAYITIVFFAVRIIPYYKNLLMALALTPTVLYQGASVTHDSISIALIFLLFALVIKFASQDKSISTKQLILFALVAWLQSCCKQGYAPLFFSILCIPITKFNSRIILYSTLCVLALFVWATPFLWDAYLASYKFPRLKFQSDFYYNGWLSIQFFMQDPFQFLSNIINNVLGQGKDWLIGLVGKFGYSYTALPWGIAFLHLCILVGISINDGQGFLQTRWTRLRFLIMGLGALALLITAAMLFRSPVGAERIFGFQGRYLIPLIPFTWPFIFYLPSFKSKIKYFHYLVAIYSIALLGYAVFYIENQFYL